MPEPITKAGWPDHYRPESLDEMALAPELRTQFERYTSGDVLPRHLILHGPPGFGKTSVAKIIARAVYPKDGWPRVRWVTAPETGNVDVIRNSVIGFMRGLPGPRLVIFEEAEGLTADALKALRDPLEAWADLCRVIFITNNVEKLDAAVRSRCDEIEMTRPPVNECARVLGRILETEGRNAAPDDLRAFTRAHFNGSSGRDLRSLLASAQRHIQSEGKLPVPPEPESPPGLRLEDLQDAVGVVETTDGAKILNDLSAEFAKYLSLPTGGVETLALWTVFAWAHEAFSIAPILTLVSPTMRAGKTTVFEMLEQVLMPELTYHASSITPAAMYRLRGMADEDQAQPPREPRTPALCMLFDEADGWLQLREEARAVLNSGHSRRGAFVFRVVSGVPARFSSWYPKALALIDAARSPLPDTLRDRSIIIPMQRMRAGERKPRFPRHRRLPELDQLREAVAYWVRDIFSELRDLAGGEIISADELNDRAKDNWQPLMAVARLAGGGWEERARQASLILSDITRDTELVVELLEDVRRVFDSEETGALRSVALAQKLASLEGSPWKEHRLNATRLSKMLRPLRIRPKQLWIDPGTGRRMNKQGYERSQFEDAFARYL